MVQVHLGNAVYMNKLDKISGINIVWQNIKEALYLFFYLFYLLYKNVLLFL